MRTAHVTCSFQSGRLSTLTPREAWKETKNWSVLAVAPHLWNTLPPEISLAPSLGIFK